MTDLDTNFATRLKLFLDSKNLISSQFADACGIPRPTLSQILTGRNKKISDVLIGQIHRAYPGLSVLWLLFGEGDMMLSSKDEEMNEDENGDEISINAHENSENIIDGIEIAVKDGENRTSNPGNQGFDGHHRLQTKIVEIAQQPPVMRKISHITVYYDDSTFETFYPKR